MVYYGTSIWMPTDSLAHHGIKGMKWGVRRWQNSDGSFNAAGKQRYFSDGSGENYKPVRSAKGNARRALAKVYDINERYYSKRGNKVMASMNKAAKEEQLKKASLADKKKTQKDSEKAAKKELKRTEKEEAARKAVDVNIAKNSATRRVADDYHRLTDAEFHGKYHTAKKVFAKRYKKSNGDTFTMGKRKQALAVAYLDRMQGKSLATTVKDIAKYNALANAKEKQLDKGHEFAAGIIEMGIGFEANRQYSKRR